MNNANRKEIDSVLYISKIYPYKQGSFVVILPTENKLSGGLKTFIYSCVLDIAHQHMGYYISIFNVFYALQQKLIQNGANYLHGSISHMCHISHCHT